MGKYVLTVNNRKGVIAVATIKDLKKQIEQTRKKLQHLMDHTENYSSDEILEISKSLDILINEYLHMTKYDAGSASHVI